MLEQIDARFALAEAAEKDKSLILCAEQLDDLARNEFQANWHDAMRTMGDSATLYDDWRNRFEYGAWHCLHLPV